MNTLTLTALLWGQITLEPKRIRDLNLLSRALKGACRYRLAPARIVHKGQVFLSALACRTFTGGSLPAWVKAQLGTESPAFVPGCVARQKENVSVDGRRVSPLAGVVVGRGEFPALYEAFFAMIKAEGMAANQAKAIREGMSFAGVSGEPLKVTDSDFIGPYTFSPGAAPDVDLRSEAALLRLIAKRPELARIHDGETVRTRGEELVTKEETFAHADVDAIGEDLRREVLEEAGIDLPNTTHSGELLKAAGAIEDDFLHGRVLDRIARLDEVDDARRVYVHGAGDEAFRTRRRA